MTQLMNWHHQRILYEVRLKGSSLRQLSLQHGLDARTITRSLYHRYPKAHRIIADFLELSPEHIWPEYYSVVAMRGSRNKRAA